MAQKFEELPIKDFLHQLNKLGEFTISSQADGLNFYFGLDADGNFYSSPFAPDKASKFCYQISDYPKESSNNPFIAAHTVLEKKLKTIEKFLQPGEAVESQLVTHTQKSTNGTANTLSIIRPVKGETGIADPKHIHELVQKLSGSKIQVNVKQLDTVDGEELHSIEAISVWKINHTKQMHGKELTSSKLKSQIQKLKHFLEQPNHKAHSIGLDMSNFAVATVNLTEIDMKLRSKLKAERERLNQEILDDYKFPIKAELLDNLESKLGAKAALLHHGSNETWLADANFMSTNRFDTVAKRKISGFQRTTDSEASLEERGGLIGVFEQRIAELLGVPELAIFQSAAKIFRENRGKNPQETAANFSKSLEHLHFQGVKQKIVAVLKNTLDKLADQLAHFKDNATSFKMVTGESETVNLSPSEIKNNLLEFAQAKHDLEHTMSEIKKAKDFASVILAIYGSSVYSVHGKHLSEEIIEESKIDLKLLTAEKICQAYTATLLATQLLLRCKDKLASNMLKDSRHAMLSKFDSEKMSPLNYWGTILFSPFLADMKGDLNAVTAKDLKKIAGRFIQPRVKKIHQTLSSNTNLIQDWELQEENAKLVVMRLSTRTTSINMVIVGTRHWDDISLSNKNTIIAKLYYYLQQSAPGSPLLSRLRILAITTLTMAANDSETIKDPVVGIQEQFLLDLMSEAEMGASTSANATSSNGFSNWADIGAGKAPDSDGGAQGKTANRANKTDMLRHYHGHQIVKRKRDFVKKKKFCRPSSEETDTQQQVQEDDAGGGATVASDTSGGGAPTELFTSSGAIATYPKRLFGTKKKRTKMIKRMIPKQFDLAKLPESLHKIVLNWPDEEYTGNPNTDPGFRQLKTEFCIMPKLIYEKAIDGWPVVELVGPKENLVEFLLNIYGADEKIINNIAPYKIGDK